MSKSNLKQVVFKYLSETNDWEVSVDGEVVIDGTDELDIGACDFLPLWDALGVEVIFDEDEMDTLP